jgi:hypothetical protein
MVSNYIPMYIPIYVGTCTQTPIIYHIVRNYKLFGLSKEQIHRWLFIHMYSCIYCARRLLNVQLLYRKGFPDQGDQMGRIFAFCAIVCFGQIFFESSPKFRRFFHCKSYVLILTENWAIFGNFSQTHLVTLFRHHSSEFVMK